MASKFSKFLALSAVLSAAGSIAYIMLNKKNDVDMSETDDDTKGFFEKSGSREYTSLNMDGMASEEEVDSKEVLKQKITESLEESEAKAKEAADGVGVVKEDNPDAEDFEFEDLTEKEDE